MKFIVCFFISSYLCANDLRIDLQQALEKKLIVVEVISRGGHEGLCINMTLKNKTRNSMIIFIEAGRRLNSLKDEEQDILVVKEASVILKALEEKKIELKGYCCQVTCHSPAKGAVYLVNNLADNRLLILARYLNTHAFDRGAEQEAVWSLSDNRPAANITAQNDSAVQDLREIVSAIKGEPLPWYRIISKKNVYSNGVIVITNLCIRGNLKYRNEKENYATLSVLDEKGLPVCEIKGEWLKASNNEIYKLDLPVKGLGKGKYTVELKTPEKQLAKQEFEI